MACEKAEIRAGVYKEHWTRIYIKQKNIFQPKGYDIAETVSAKIVQSNTTVYDLEV